MPATRDEPDAPRRLAPWYILLATVAGASLLRLPALAAADLSIDEHLSIGLSHLRLTELFTEIAGRPPLLFLSQKVAIELAGRASPSVLRIPSVLFGIATVAMFYGFLSGLRNRRAGLIGCLLLGTSAFHIAYSREGRYYALLCLTCLGVLAGLSTLLKHPRWFPVALTLTAAIATGLIHYVGFLYLGAIAATLPIAIAASPEWRTRLSHGLKNPAGVATTLFAFAMDIALTWRYLETLTEYLRVPDLDAPLPEFFDTSPGFLFHNFSHYLGVGPVVSIGALALALLGLFALLRNALPVAIVTLGAVILPFPALWLVRPDHWWEPKYFIFMVPILLAWVAVGIDVLATVAESKTPGRHAVRGLLVSTLLVAAIAVPNLSLVARAYQWPDQTFQRFAVSLGAWTDSSDGLIAGSPDYKRVLDTYIEVHEAPLATTLTSDLAGPHWAVAWQPRAWYLHAGKMMTPEEDAAIFLSGRLARLPGNNAMLAYGPHPARIEFGVTLPAQAGSENAVIIPNIDTLDLNILFPLAGEHRVLVTAEPQAQRPESLRLTIRDSHAPLLPASGEVTSPLFMGKLNVPAGLQTVRLTTTGSPLPIQRIEFLPAISDAPLTLPAWAFVEVTGAPPLNAVWTEFQAGVHRLRDLQARQSAVYRVFFERSGTAQVLLSAVNDAPGVNKYQVVVQGQSPDYHVLEFPHENNEVSTESTPPFEVVRGAYTIAVGYLGVSIEDYNRRTENGKIQTLERLQTSGLESLTIHYVPQ